MDNGVQRDRGCLPGDMAGEEEEMKEKTLFGLLIGIAMYDISFLAFSSMFQVPWITNKIVLFVIGVETLLLGSFAFYLLINRRRRRRG